MWCLRSKRSGRDPITESLRALKTLKCEHGRVSVDATEIIQQPGYLEARVAAARLIHAYATRGQVKAPDQTVRKDNDEEGRKAPPIESVPEKVRRVVEPTHRCLEQQLISDVLFGYARGLPGAGLDDEGLIRVATQEFSGRAFRIVRGWMVLDVIADEGVLGKGSREMQQRTVLLVQHVVFDSEGKQSEWRVSSYGNHVDGCFFETPERIYVLAGRGARRHVSAPTVEALRAYGDGD